MQGLLLHTKTADTSRGDFFKVNNLPATLLDMKVHPKVQNLFRCQVASSSSAPARILGEAFVLRNRGF
jgi:hypothetical protein